jgi:hypothetical protein
MEFFETVDGFGEFAFRTDRDHFDGKPTIRPGGWDKSFRVNHSAQVIGQLLADRPTLALLLAYSNCIRRKTSIPFQVIPVIAQNLTCAFT